jgi:hypothetical protein
VVVVVVVVMAIKRVGECFCFRVAFAAFYLLFSPLDSLECYFIAFALSRFHVAFALILRCKFAYRLRNFALLLLSDSFCVVIS